MYKPLVLFVIMFSGFQLCAQTSVQLNDTVKEQKNLKADKKFTFGVKLSPSVSWVNVVNNDVHSDGAALNYGVGGVVNYTILSNLSLVSGLNYNVFGGYVYDKKSMSDTLYRRNYNVSYRETELPVALKINTTTVDKTAFFLESGLSLGFISGAFEKRIPLDKNTTPLITDVYSFTSTVRVSCFIGGGVEYEIGSGLNLFGLISYKSSLTNVANSTYVPNRYSNTLQMFPGNLDFSVGIMF